MRLEHFRAEADVVGRRVRVRWGYVAEGPRDEVTGEPNLRLFGKARDFEYGSERNNYQLFDSATFPPSDGPDVDVVEVRRPVVHEGDNKLLVDVMTVARRDLPPAPPDPDRAALPPDERPDAWTEVARRTRTTVVAPDGRIVARTDEILDIGGGAGLEPLVTRYYELVEVVDGRNRVLGRAVATPTAAHRSGRALYDLLPAVWRRHDVPPAGIGTSSARFGAIPEARQDSGQLRRFVDLFGVATDHLRSRAEGLRNLHDIEDVDHRMLPHLAHLVGWDLSADVPIPQQRHEIRYAANLYRLTGTVPGVQLWAKRLTSWDVEVTEFAENVLHTNDVGGDNGVTRSGSRTVDTADADLVASLGSARDEGDFTYDTGLGPDDRYSTHTIGIFATYDAEDRVEDVARKRDRLLAASDRYLPANLRVVVVLPDDSVETEAHHLLSLTASTIEDL